MTFNEYLNVLWTENFGYQMVLNGFGKIEKSINKGKNYSKKNFWPWNFYDKLIFNSYILMMAIWIKQELLATLESSRLKNCGLW